MTRFAPLLVAAIGLSVLVACTPAESDGALAEADGDAGAQVTPTTAPPSPPETLPLSLVPLPLTRAEWSALDLAGELGCAFARDASDDPLLLALGFVGATAPAQAAIKLDDQPVKLTMDRPGGYDTLVDGGRFTGADGISAEVAVTGDEPLVEEPQVAMESTQYRATLTLARGARGTDIDGIWECGP